MTVLTLGKTTGWSNSKDVSEKVDLNSLSELTGFPVDFIKKELMLDEEKVSMNRLRGSVAKFLDDTASQFKK